MTLFSPVPALCMKERPEPRFCLRHGEQTRWLHDRQNIGDIYYIAIMARYIVSPKMIEVMYIYCAICWYMDYCDRPSPKFRLCASILMLSPCSWTVYYRRYKLLSWNYFGTTSRAHVGMSRGPNRPLYTIIPLGMFPWKLKLCRCVAPRIVLCCDLCSVIPGLVDRVISMQRTKWMCLLILFTWSVRLTLVQLSS